MRILSMCKGFALGAAMLVGSMAQASYVYVGSWLVGDGVAWTDNPPVYSAQDAAALLFGGTAADYVISTVDNQVANINFRAHVDGWGDDTYLYDTVAQSFKVDSGNPGYNDPVGGPSYSAYVHDHSCFNRYSNAAEVCGADEPGRNFAFRVSDVPETGTWAMMLVGFGAIGAGIRSRSRTIAVA